MIFRGLSSLTVLQFEGQGSKTLKVRSSKHLLKRSGLEPAGSALGHRETGVFAGLSPGKPLRLGAGLPRACAVASGRAPSLRSLPHPRLLPVREGSEGMCVSGSG